MARRLPDDPTKFRLQIFKRIYQNLQHFRSLIEAGEMEFPGIIHVPSSPQMPEGEDIYLLDMLIGLPSLPDRQRQAFELICLQGYTEGAATDIMLPGSRFSTPIQQYADSALARMVAAYDQKQADSTWRPKTYVKRTKCKQHSSQLQPDLVSV